MSDMDNMTTVNDCGTPVTVMTCAACGHEFTVCPALPEGNDWGADCLGDLCPSYDIARDVDMFFEPAVGAGLIRQIEP